MRPATPSAARARCDRRRIDGTEAISWWTASRLCRGQTRSPMATPIGHGIVGYTIARAAGVRSRKGLALSIGAASLPDVDLLLGYMANHDLLSLHPQLIT